MPQPECSNFYQKDRATIEQNKTEKVVNKKRRAGIIYARYNCFFNRSISSKSNLVVSLIRSISNPFFNSSTATSFFPISFPISFPFSSYEMGILSISSAFSTCFASTRKISSYSLFNFRYVSKKPYNNRCFAESTCKRTSIRKNSILT